jgi:putative transposase
VELIRYLHLNPVRAVMVKDPKLYRWSSHGEYLRGRSQSGIAVDHGLALWGASQGQAIKAYQRFVIEGLEAGHQEEYYEVKEQRYLGDEEFVEGVRRALDQEEETWPVKITMAEVIEELVKGIGLSIAGVINKGRGRTGSRLRAEAAYLGREVGGIGITEAAKYLGRDQSTMSLAVKRLEEALEGDTKRRKQLENLCARLRRGKKRRYQTSNA